MKNAFIFVCIDVICDVCTFRFLPSLGMNQLSEKLCLGQCPHITKIFPGNGMCRVYYQKRCEFESRSWCNVLNSTLCDKVCQRLTTCLLFSLDTLVPSAKLTTTIKLKYC